MNQEQANNIIYRLIEENCFAESGRLGIYPDWLKYEDMQWLVSIGVFRQETGNGDTMGHTDYYLNPCCERQALSNDCEWPNCIHFHFKKAVEHTLAADLCQRCVGSGWVLAVSTGAVVNCPACNGAGIAAKA